MTATLLPDAVDTPRKGADPHDSRSPASAPGPGRARRVVRGRPDDPAWVRPGLLALLAGTAVLYLWGLGASGWANSFYSAAVQAGSVSWKAFFFGSSDASNFITVDKTPGALWVMELSARLFGVNAWSILVPQALEGVASVGVLYLAVRRWFSPGAGLLAGAVLALTPIATLMFRYNNPDALLVLLLTAGAYALTRAIEAGRTRWLVMAFSLIGFGFLAKMLQAFVVVPVFAGAYLVAAPNRFRTRLWQLALAGAAMLASAGWWVAIVELWPKSSRPYIGGSQTNSVLNLLFGYNGFGRLTGNETGSVGGGGTTGTGVWGATGWSRMFNAEFGGQASWLIPTALLLLGAGLVATARRPRTDRTRAALLLWGGWLVVTGAVFSFGKGIIHPYYAVALAPAIGALVGIGATTWWARRHEPAARMVMASALAATVAWATVLFHRSPSWYPGLGGAVLATGLALALVLLLTPRLRGRLAMAVAAGAIVVALAGPAAASLTTAATTSSGAIPSAGPSVAGGRGPGGGPVGGGPGGGLGGGGPVGGPGGGGGGVGSILGSSTATPALVSALHTGRSRFTWVAAAVGSNQAAGYQLASGSPVMAIGGFNGSDPTPTLAQFQAYVAAGRIHYFIATGSGGATGRGQTSSTSTAISTWVTSHYTATTIGGTTVYDLTAVASS